MVQARADVRGEPYLAAFLVPEPGVAAAELASAELREELRRHLGRSLPAYMLPAVFVALPALPLNVHGKVDRRALPDPEALRGETSGRPPVTATERTLARIWGELLARPEISLDDDFFGLGGHSLLAAGVVARVEAELGVQLPLAELFTHSTIAGLARALDERGASASRGLRLPALVPRPDPTAELVPSFAQERMWVISRLQPSSALYNMPVALELRGELRPAALAASLQALAARHEVLRTTYHAEGGRLVPRLDRRRREPLPVVDFQRLDAPVAEAAADELTAREAARPFDLERGPVLLSATITPGKWR